MSFHFIETCGRKIEDIPPPSVNLTRDRTPEYLIEHNTRLGDNSVMDKLSQGDHYHIIIISAHLDQVSVDLVICFIETHLALRNGECVWIGPIQVKLSKILRGK